MKENRLEVVFHNKLVGTLSETVNHKIAFAYAPEWLENGFPVSPFSLPLRQEVFVPTSMNFGGMFGVFADSLPDAWGQLLMKKMFTQRGINMDDVNMLERLAVIGSSGMGALSYRPAWGTWKQPDYLDLDELSAECQRILNQEESGDADRMFALAGSSGGARPKVMTDEWIIKFPVSRDHLDSGVMEKAYMDCARQCDIIVPETRLLPSKTCSGYFSIRRFDRTKTPDGKLKRHHMLTVAAILEQDWRAPSLDYHSLMKLTKILCHNQQSELEQMYRRMCFNVFAHNRDDHSKNFSYLYDEQRDQWSLSPAYDLTWSSTFYGEHTTTVDGNGHNPGMKELLAVGRVAGLPQSKCKQIAQDIQEKTTPLISHFGK